MTFADLSDQLVTLSDALKTQNARISRLAKFSHQTDSEVREGKGGVRSELAQDIHESLKQLDYDYESLRQEAEFYHLDEIPGARRQSSAVGDDEEARVSARLARLAEELLHSRQQFRNAQVTAKRAAESARLKEREELLESYRKEAAALIASEKSAVSAKGDANSSSGRDQLFAHRSKVSRSKNQTKDEILVDASSDVTAALRRTHDLLATELSRSRFAQETFDESTAALAQLGEDYSNLDSILSNSRNLLGTLLRSQKSDTWYLETAFYILLATLCWLFFRRIFFGPFIKLPLFLARTLLFFANWILLKPLWFFLTATGVIISEPVTTTTLSTRPYTPSSSTSLIIQPSASGGLPRIPARDKERLNRAGVPAGAGGAGAKIGRNPSLFEQIGQMADASEGQDKVASSQQQDQPQTGSSADVKVDSDPPRRGDGTILQERGDIPKNPKKKGFEDETVETRPEQQMRQKRDEL